MKTTTITGTLASSVTLGSHGVWDTLTITGSGAVAPLPAAYITSSYGLNGVFVRPQTSNASITNLGAIHGGSGYYYRFDNGKLPQTAGGAGMQIDGTNATIVNAGLISGGQAIYNVGGNGINLAGAGFSLDNTGTILGGFGYYNSPTASGMGVNVSAAGELENRGSILGGAGANGVRYGDLNGGNGAIGLRLTASGSNATNDGLIAGGDGGGGASEMYGNGIIRGGDGYGAGAVFAANGATLTNHGTILGGIGTQAGIGVLLTTASSLTNSGAIIGGITEKSYRSNDVSAGTGVDAGRGTFLSNSGTIAGGAGFNAVNYYYRYYRGSGGIGLVVNGAASASNSGLITGGAGGQANGQLYVNGKATGGIGVELSGGTTLTNTGTIVGGAGAVGGVGLTLASATLMNAGTISGGTVPASDPTPTPAAGIGVQINGGLITTSGTIAGGVLNGQYADAVQFGAKSATLAITSTAVFEGAVAANAAANDVLQLTGTTAGTLTGLGTTFTGFTTLNETAGSNWTLAEANTMGAGSMLHDHGTLAVSGSLTGVADATVFVSGTLQADANATIQINSITLAGGRLENAASGIFAIGPTLQGAAAGHITVEAGASLTGFGRVDTTGVIADNGTIDASGGSLILFAPVNGTGTLTIGTGATLATGGVITVKSVLFAAGGNETLIAGQGAGITSVISGFSSTDTLTLKGVDAATTSFQNNTLTLLNSAGAAIEHLVFTGDYAGETIGLQTSNTLTVSVTGAADHLAAGWAGPERFDTAILSEHFVGLWNERF